MIQGTQQNTKHYAFFTIHERYIYDPFHFSLKRALSEEVKTVLSCDIRYTIYGCLPEIRIAASKELSGYKTVFVFGYLDGYSAITKVPSPDLRRGGGDGGIPSKPMVMKEFTRLGV